MITYTINPETFAVSLSDENAVFLIQEKYPNGETFQSIEQATQWADAAVLSYFPEATRYAPQGPEDEGELKPTTEDLNEWHRIRILQDPTLEEFRNELIKEVP